MSSKALVTFWWRIGMELDLSQLQNYSLVVVKWPPVWALVPSLVISADSLPFSLVWCFYSDSNSLKINVILLFTYTAGIVVQPTTAGKQTFCDSVSSSTSDFLFSSSFSSDASPHFCCCCWRNFARLFLNQTLTKNFKIFIQWSFATYN